MIESTTDFLNEKPKCSKDFTEESTKCENKTDQKLKLEFIKQYISIQTWFLRCSWQEKYRLLLDIVKAIKRISSLGLIIDILFSACEKSTVYEECYFSTEFVYDKTLNDNNRSLNAPDLENQKRLALEWFREISDSQQINIFISLLRLSGGSMIRRIYQVVVSVYTERKKGCMDVKDKKDKIVALKDVSLNAFSSKVNIAMKDGKAQSGKKTEAPKKVSYVEKELDQRDFFDFKPDSPLAIEVEKQRKTWNDVISKYRIQVEGKPKKQKDGGKKGKKSKTRKGGNKKKKGKKGKKGKTVELDRIQMLPIWVAKKIFNYFDQKALKKLKSVNNYWSYVIGDVTKDRSVRKGLNKVIQKMEETDDDIVEIPAYLFGDKKLSTVDRKLLKASNRGATIQKLQVPLKEPLQNASIVDGSILTINRDQMPAPYENFEAFARNIRGNLPLYKPPYCTITEIGKVIKWDDYKKDEPLPDEPMMVTSVASSIYDIGTRTYKSSRSLPLQSWDKISGPMTLDDDDDNDDMI